MTNKDSFRLVGMLPRESLPEETARGWRRYFRGKPVAAMALLAVIGFCCLFAELMMTHDPTYLDLANANVAPNGEFLFGTDALGRDLFSMIWYGGRVSLAIGLLSTAISTVIAVVYGCISGLSSRMVDNAMMRATEILLSIPSILIVILLQAVLGEATVLSISLVIGVTGWMNIAKVVRSEVRQIRGCDYVLAARCMGGGFFHILGRHLLPNFLSSIMFMVVTNIGTAIATEATLSFLGIGLPLEIVSWGSMLSSADRALLSNNWWVIVIPGLFIVLTLVCFTAVGNHIRKRANKGFSNI